jgi:hypothetical protein
MWNDTNIIDELLGKDDDSNNIQVFLTNYCCEHTKEVLREHGVLDQNDKVLNDDFMITFRKVVKKLTEWIPNAAHSSPGWDKSFPLLTVGTCAKNGRMKPRVIGLCIEEDEEDKIPKIYPFLDEIEKNKLEGNWILWKHDKEKEKKPEFNKHRLSIDGEDGLNKLENYLKSKNGGITHTGGVPSDIPITPKVTEGLKKKQEASKGTTVNKNTNNSSEEMNIPLNTILYGPPGTGKTFNTINEALKIIDSEFFDANKDNREELKKTF